MIDEINAQGKWQASNDFVKDMTVAQAKMLTGTRLDTFDPIEFPERSWGTLLDYLSVPASFDSRTQWPNCVNYIRDQGQCGSCWAFGASEALSDRYCIQKNISVLLSAQWLVSCDSLNMGCNGGYLSLAWFYLKNSGLPIDSCDPYTSGTTQQTESCPLSCVDGSAPKKFKAVSIHSYKSPSAIQAAIMEGGPIEAAFTVYQDFMSYTGGVYKHTTGSVLGGHAIKIVGWGVEGSTNYWIVANSWGTSWGESGYFRIAFGQCGIDSAGIAGNAA
jgi:cathepsin B